MEVNTEINTFGISKYGMPEAGTHNYLKRDFSGLPQSYADLISNIAVELKIQEHGGIFLDVGGGTGQLTSAVKDRIGVKGFSIDCSSFGMIESGNKGVVAEAGKISLPNGVVSIVHIKDVIEHLDDQRLYRFVSEARRVLTNEGRVVVTEKDYRKGFPHFDESYITVVAGGSERTEYILPGEITEQLINRLRKKYGDNAKFNMPYFVRSQKDIAKQMKKSGFRLEKSRKWRAKKNEPDWFVEHPPRNVMIFSIG